MSSTSTVSQSAQALGDILQYAQAKTLDQAKKQMELTVKMSLGKEGGKGSEIDLSA